MDVTEVVKEVERSKSVVQALEDGKKSKKSAAQEDTLGILASSLQTTFRAFISDKEPIEERWIRDLTQYHGQYYTADAPGFNEETSDRANKSKRSRLFVNITRPKTDSAEARMSDMLFPTDDKNWEIEATPNPEMSDALSNQDPVKMGDREVLNSEVESDESPPMVEGDLAKEELSDIKKRAGKMSVEIEDQFIECRYSAEARLSIRDGCLIGTGILKGPMQVGKTRRVWVPKMDQEAGEQVHVLEIKEVVKPYIYRVDPWDFFPDMTANKMEDCEKSFEIHYKTRVQMKELLKTPGYIESQVRRVLETTPNRSGGSRVTDHLEQLRALAGINTAYFKDSRYHLIEYHGPIDKDVLIALGVDVDEDNPLDMQEGFVWFVDDIVVKIATHHMDSEDRLYSVFNWEKDDASLFGYGVPYTLRDPQKVISAAWRMIMDNAGLSTGPQIVINKEVLEPANGKWELEPRKVWYAIEDDIDVTKAFTTFNIESHQQELLQIFGEAKKLAEEESNLPMVSQGMGYGGANRTFSGMSMQMNASNISLRRAVKYWDDHITVPILTRMYDWNMQFNPDNDIKGDYEVRARGTGALLVKELQSQGLLQLMAYADSPTFGPMMKPAKALRMVAKSLYVDPKEIVKDDDEIAKDEKDRQAAASEQPQVSPDVQAKIEAQMQIAQGNSAQKGKEIELKYAQLERGTEELVAKMEQEFQLTLKDIEARYGIAVEDRDWDAQKFYDELKIKLELGSGI